MRLGGVRESSNIEDRRGMGSGGMITGGGIGTLIIGLIIMLLGGDPGSVLPPAGADSPSASYPGADADAPPSASAPTTGGPSDPQRLFVGRVLTTTEDSWTRIFQQMGRQYQPPRLVLFSGATQSACGYAQAATGPFYCPPDQKVYIDLSFYDELRGKFGASGDFAQGYVIAHEVGHHVQNLLGISDQVRQAEARGGRRQANALSVRLELQADCFAGIWGNANRNLLEAGDVEEALNAASAIGDDRLQQQSQGYVVPESFTHGTSEQRARWFRRGFDAGDARQCDTFNATQL